MLLCTHCSFLFIFRHVVKRINEVKSITNFVKFEKKHFAIAHIISFCIEFVFANTEMELGNTGDVDFRHLTALVKKFI